MNKIIIILLVIFVCACSSGKQKIVDGIETIPVEVDNTCLDPSSFIDKIEIVPLETNDSSLLNESRKIMYDKEMDIYAIYNRQQIVYTFSGNGDFIGNSSKVKGGGPKEYDMALDMKFNPYLKGIDLLSPYGTIYTYSPAFKFLSNRKFKPEFPVDYLLALTADDYIFNHPSLWTDQEVSFVNLKTQQTNNTNYNGTVSSGNSMDQECFYRISNQFYFVPLGVNYYFYQIDTKEMQLIPIMYLDFGDSEIKEDGLPGRATGKRVALDKERMKISASTLERSRFLRASNSIIPMIKFFNDDYVYIYFVKSTKGIGSNFIFNRKTREGFLVKDQKPFLMPPCFALADNALLSFCPPDRLSQVIDRRLMSAEEIHKMEQLKEEDNPVILKYYLK